MKGDTLLAIVGGLVLFGGFILLLVLGGFALWRLNKAKPAVKGKAPAATPASNLEEVIEAVLQEKIERKAPPKPNVFESLREAKPQPVLLEHLPQDAQERLAQMALGEKPGNPPTSPLTAGATGQATGTGTPTDSLLEAARKLRDQIQQNNGG